jgi:hypothetical protein
MTPARLARWDVCGGEKHLRYKSRRSVVKVRRRVSGLS